MFVMGAEQAVATCVGVPIRPRVTSQLGRDDVAVMVLQEAKPPEGPRKGGLGAHPWQRSGQFVDRDNLGFLPADFLEQEFEGRARLRAGPIIRKVSSSVIELDRDPSLSWTSLPDPVERRSRPWFIHGEPFELPRTPP